MVLPAFAAMVLVLTGIVKAILVARNTVKSSKNVTKFLSSTLYALAVEVNPIAVQKAVTSLSIVVEVTFVTGVVNVPLQERVGLAFG